jgi:small subunit ribosomal protein S20
MAHTKSALKRIRQDKKRNQRNQSVKSTVRTATRAFRETLEEGDAAKTQTAFRTASKTLCKAATKGVVRKQTASRRISRLAKAAHKSLSAAK